MDDKQIAKDIILAMLDKGFFNQTSQEDTVEKRIERVGNAYHLIYEIVKKSNSN